LQLLYYFRIIGPPTVRCRVLLYC